MNSRNQPCGCGSGKKYKRCHWLIEQEMVAETFVSVIAKKEYDKMSNYWRKRYLKSIERQTENGQTT